MPWPLNALSLLLLVFLLKPALWAQAIDSTLTNPLSKPEIYKTSFDCTKAKELSMEEAICQNEDLATLDLEMAQSYKQRLDFAPAPQKSRVILSQERWLKIRNSYNVNPYHGDPVGTLADLADFYRSRITALRSRRVDQLDTPLPQEYEWLVRIAPDGFSKKEFSIGRGYMGCEDPCKSKPSVYRLLSIGGSGVGEMPGDINTPFAQLQTMLSSHGWSPCRSADDSGNTLVDYFKKGSKFIAIRRSYSMGVGNGIGLAITVSGPLSDPPGKMPPNPTVTITSEWQTYSSPDVGLQVRYPPGWWIRDDSSDAVFNRGTKYLTFVAKDFSGSFRISMVPKERWNRSVSQPENARRQCFPYSQGIAGFPSQACMQEGEAVWDDVCHRSLDSVEIDTGEYHLSFQPTGWGSFPDAAGQYKFTDLYEKIISTIRVR
jgi:uncharacterized protein YecT (DUF1311 family)